MLNLFPRFRFPLMFRYVHERHVASLRFDIEQLQNALNYEHKQCEGRLAHQLKHANLALAESHARAAKPRNELKALDAAYQKDKEQMARIFRSPAYHQELGYAILPFATFRQQEVSYS
jgi:DNA repair exonuclease SbcCD ATPase subunit